MMQWPYSSTFFRLLRCIWRPACAVLLLVAGTVLTGYSGVMLVQSFRPDAIDPAMVATIAPDLMDARPLSELANVQFSRFYIPAGVAEEIEIRFDTDRNTLNGDWSGKNARLLVDGSAVEARPGRIMAFPKSYDVGYTHGRKASAPSIRIFPTLRASIGSFAASENPLDVVASMHVSFPTLPSSQSQISGDSFTRCISLYVATPEQHRVLEARQTQESIDYARQNSHIYWGLQLAGLCLLAGGVAFARPRRRRERRK